MMLAARMKKGIASSGKLSSPANTRCDRIDSGIGVVRAKTTKAVPVSTMNIGMVRNRPSASSVKISAMVMPVLPKPRFGHQSCRSMANFSSSTRSSTSRHSTWQLRSIISTLPAGMAR